MAFGSRKVFIDSSFFLSFIDRADLNHNKTISIFELLARQNYQLFTTSIIILQTFNRIDRDMGSSVSHDFLQAILDSAIKILYISESELLFVYRFFKNSPYKQLNILELMTARVMDRQGINSILTYDPWHNITGTSKSPLLNPEYS